MQNKLQILQLPISIISIIYSIFNQNRRFIQFLQNQSNINLNSKLYQFTLKSHQMDKKKYLHFFQKPKYIKNQTEFSLYQNQNQHHLTLEIPSQNLNHSQGQISHQNNQPTFKKTNKFSDQFQFAEKGPLNHQFLQKKLKNTRQLKIICDKIQQKKKYENQGIRRFKQIQNFKKKHFNNKKEKQLNNTSNDQKTLHKISSKSFNLSNSQKFQQKRELIYQTRPISFIRPYDRNKTAPNKKLKSKKTSFGDLNSSCRNYNDLYTISLQNLRMGWRILNTKSMIEEYLHNTYFNYQIYNGKLVNKQKLMIKSNKQNKKNHLKSQQEKNVINTFFNKNNMFRTKQSRKNKLFHSLSQKNNRYPNLKRQSQNPPQRSLSNIKKNSKSLFFNEEIQKKINRKDNILKPVFFKEIYFPKEKNVSQKIEKQT